MGAPTTQSPASREAASLSLRQRIFALADNDTNASFRGEVQAVLGDWRAASSLRSGGLNDAKSHKRSFPSLR